MWPDKINSLEGCLLTIWSAHLAYSKVLLIENFFSYKEPKKKVNDKFN